MMRLPARAAVSDGDLNVASTPLGMLGVSYRSRKGTKLPRTSGMPGARRLDRWSEATARTAC
jgi:hypothetical protein